MNINFRARTEENEKKDGYMILKQTLLPKEKHTIHITFSAKPEKKTSRWIEKWFDLKTA